MSVAVPGLTQAWGLLAAIATAALLRRAGIPLWRDALPAEPGLGAPLEKPAGTALLVFALALGFQLLRWLAEGGALRSRPGDDDEGYVFLAYQIQGLVEGVPVFALRAPGWPLVIAGLTRIAGLREIWVVGLFHRILLALLPPVYVLILGRFLRRPAAVIAALLAMMMEYNEIIAATALSDVLYMALGLFTASGLLHARVSEHKWPWLVASGLLAAARALIRLTGLPVALAAGAAYFLIERGSVLRRAGWASLASAPALAAVLALSAYNRSTAGHFAPGMGPGITFFTQYGTFYPRVPDTPALREIAPLLPEVPPEYLFLAYRDSWVAQYRFTAGGHGDVFDYGALLSRAILEIVRAAPGPLVARAAQGVVVMLLDPLRWIAPQWAQYAPDAHLPYTLRISGDLPACNMQVAFGAAVEDVVCQQYADLRAWLNWEPPGLVRLPARLQQAAHLLSVSLPYRLRGLLWPLHWGIAAFASLGFLVSRPTTRKVALLIGIPLLAEFALVIAFTNGIETRYLFYFHPAYWILIWLALAFLIRPAVSHQPEPPAQAP